MNKLGDLIVTCENLDCGKCVACRFVRLRQLVANVCANHGDDHCWMNLEPLAKEVGVELNMHVGDKAAMLKNCERYVELRCKGGGPWKTYAELEAENADLRLRLESRGAHACDCQIPIGNHT